jgi:hypothetical protein
MMMKLLASNVIKIVDLECSLPAVDSRKSGTVRQRVKKFTRINSTKCSLK